MGAAPAVVDLALEMGDDEVEEGGGVMALGGMADHAGGLVEDQGVGVLVADIERADFGMTREAGG